MWLLGSSDYSARLAAEQGLPYVFAHHFSGRGTAEALALYRDELPALPELAEPRTFLTVNAVVAPRPPRRPSGWRCPHLLAMVALRTGGAAGPAAARRGGREGPLPPSPPRRWSTRCASRWVVGAPDAARARIAELAATYGVDEVMVHPVAGAHAGTDPAAARPARRRCGCWPTDARDWVRRRLSD